MNRTDCYIFNVSILNVIQILFVQEKDKMYLDLKNLLQQQPSSEVLEKSTAVQQNLSKVTKRMKAVAAELNMCHAQVRL